jgi:hypothetical protein
VHGNRDCGYGNGKCRGLLANLISYSQDGDLRGIDCDLCTTNQNLCGGIDAIVRFININLSSGDILYLEDVSTTFAKDTRDRTSGNIECENLVVFLFNSRVSSNSDFALATPFLPPLMRTSSGLSCSLVLLSPFLLDERGKVILTL